MSNAWREKIQDVARRFDLCKGTCVVLSGVVPFDQCYCFCIFAKDVDKCFSDTLVPEGLLCVYLVVICWFPSNSQTECSIVDGCGR